MQYEELYNTNAEVARNCGAFVLPLEVEFIT